MDHGGFPPSLLNHGDFPLSLEVRLCIRVAPIATIDQVVDHGGSHCHKRSGSGPWWPPLSLVVK